MKRRAIIMAISRLGAIVAIAIRREMTMTCDGGHSPRHKGSDSNENEGREWPHMHQATAPVTSSKDGKISKGPWKAKLV